MSNDPGAASATSEATLAFVTQLSETFRGQVLRAINCELDWSETSLAFVDHYLTLARGETREAILTLLSGGAGAYFGEVVRREIGGCWIGDGRDPRRLRMLVGPQFIHFCPVDLALEAISMGEGQGPDGAPLDSAFRLNTKAPQLPESAEPRTPIDDAAWIEDRLAERAPVRFDQYYSLTGRYESLTLILELLAVKHASEGREPTNYTLADYVSGLVEDI